MTGILAFQALDTFRTAQVLRQIGDIHRAGRIAALAIRAFFLVAYQPQRGELIEWSQNSS